MVDRGGHETQGHTVETSIYIYILFYVTYHTCKYAYTYTYSPLSPSSWLRAQCIKPGTRNEPQNPCPEATRLATCYMVVKLKLQQHKQSLPLPDSEAHEEESARTPVGNMPQKFADRTPSTIYGCRCGLSVYIYITTTCLLNSACLLGVYLCGRSRLSMYVYIYGYCRYCINILSLSDIYICV